MPAASSPFTVAPLRAADRGLGHLAALIRWYDGALAIGGTYHKPTLLRSADGRSFHPCPVPRTPGLRDITQLPDGALLLCGEYGALHRSDDGGARWTETLIDTDSCLYSFAGDRRGALHVTGDAGGLWRSTDDGATWIAEPTGVPARLLHAKVVDDELLVLDDRGALHRRGPGGSLASQTLTDGAALTGLVELPSGTLIVTGDRGVLRRSTDRGRTWHAVDAGTDADLEDAAWTEHGLFLVGDRGTVLHADDDGRRVVRVPSRQTRHLWSILAFGAGALIGGDEGLIVRLGHRDELELASPGEPAPDRKRRR